MPRQQSVRFPDDLAHAINREAERANRSFSYLVIEACRTHYLPPAALTGQDAENERAHRHPSSSSRDAGTPLPSIAPRRTRP